VEFSPAAFFQLFGLSGVDAEKGASTFRLLKRKSLGALRDIGGNFGNVSEALDL